MLKEVVEKEPQVLENICKRCGCELPKSDWDTKPVIMCPQCSLLINRTENLETQPDLYAPIPDIAVRWRRGAQRVSFLKPNAHLVIGIRGSGKSSLLEALSVRHRKIIDLYGSADNESLGYCKPQFERVWRSIHGYPPRILLVSGNNRDIASKFYTCHIDEMNLQKFEDYDVITTCQAFHSSEDQYFACLAEMTNILWTQRTHWRDVWFVLIREASNFIYARQKVVRNDNFAKAEFIKAFRTSRHSGLSVSVDSLRWTALDKEVRDLADYVWIKNVGAIGLPQDLSWVYKYYIPYSLMRMKPKTFILSTAKGALGAGTFSEISWHKQEHEDLLRICGIEIKNIHQAVPDDRTYNLGNFDHAQIIEEYLQSRSMVKTATTVAKSYKTVRNHLLAHNASIQLHGQCMKCHNAKGEHVNTVVEIRAIGRPTVASIPTPKSEPTPAEVEEPIVVKTKRKWRLHR